jgi:phosphoribosyl-ATP pyrophosphohydrolase/phosphoribosyl-AMP cyclohydrolase
VQKLMYDENGLIPAIIQDARDGRVLMLAYMNEEALQKTLEAGETWFYSRSRRKLWHKGETSGHTQAVRSIAYDCDADALLIQVEQKGSACHTGAASCFYRKLHMRGAVPEGSFLPELERIIAERKAEMPEGSYVAGLFRQGLDRILKKIAEEAGEVIIAAKNEEGNELIYECGDLLFHLLVLLAAKNITLAEISSELARRHRPDKSEEKNNDC